MGCALRGRQRQVAGQHPYPAGWYQSSPCCCRRINLLTHRSRHSRHASLCCAAAAWQSPCDAPITRSTHSRVRIPVRARSAHSIHSLLRQAAAGQPGALPAHLLHPLVVAQALAAAAGRQPRAAVSTPLSRAHAGTGFIHAQISHTPMHPTCMFRARMTPFVPRCWRSGRAASALHATCLA